MTNLTGSPKQINWAGTIRAEKFAAITELREQFERQGRNGGYPEDVIARELGQFDAAIAKLESRDSAAWWIDRRGLAVRHLLAEVAR